MKKSNQSDSPSSSHTSGDRTSRAKSRASDPLANGTGRYKLYGKIFAFIPAYYPGLKVRELEHCGRIVLDEVINDPPRTGS
jgi:hypothetical protein